MKFPNKFGDDINQDGESKMKNKLGIIIILVFNTVSVLLAQEYGDWILTDSLNEARADFAGIVLDDGNILAAGTTGSPHSRNTCEVFDVKEMKWHYIPSMNSGRANHTLEKLKSGEILAIGGSNINTTEILNNTFSEWKYVDTLKRKRLYAQTTTCLKDGRVLLVGGYSDYPTSDTALALNECELFNPETQKWEVTASLNTGRFFHTATLLQDGRVLVAGGSTIKNGYLSSCEIFDPHTNKWNLAAPMNFVRANHSADLLPDGKVIVFGGRLKKVELYDPSINKWEVVGETQFTDGENKSRIIKDGKYAVLISMDNIGWELFSIENFQSVYYEQFSKYIYDQVVEKIDENRILLAGGYEVKSVGGMPLLDWTAFCEIYDFTLSDVNDVHIDTEKLQSNNVLTCYPNPFNDLTHLGINVINPSHFVVEFYNILGQKLMKLYDGELAAGKHWFTLNANQIASGVYFVVLKSNEKIQLIKIIHLK